VLTIVVLLGAGPYRKRTISYCRASSAVVLLPDRNEKARLRIRLCARRSTPRAKFIPKFSRLSEQSRCRPAMAPILSNNQKGRKMLNKLIAATAMAAIAYAVVPANAAKINAGCSGDNLSKTETMIENMADGAGKITAQKEIAAAQDAMLNGKMGACASHLSKAMHVGTAK
jgi:hypothetical protein